ncbi:MAG: four helix bundle protein, partial [Verrucomicrobia bacterium]|nr:four helix bundle protein [Verrucomicrobiota bacterium]
MASAHLRFFLLAFRNPDPNRNRLNRLFDHETLEVYQAALSFIEWLKPMLQKLPKSVAVTDQLDRASTSIPLNLA